MKHRMVPVPARTEHSYTVEHPSRLSTRGTQTISYLSPLLAVVVGILHSALAPVIVVGGVKPNVVLVAVVLVTAFAGFLPGVVWAFVAGLTANLLVGDALGSVPLTMLLVAALVAGLGRVMGPFVWIFPVVAAFVGSVVADLGSLAIAQLLAPDPVTGPVPGTLVIGAATLNAALCGLLLYPVRTLAARWVADESPAW